MRGGNDLPNDQTTEMAFLRKERQEFVDMKAVSISFMLMILIFSGCTDQKKVEELQALNAQLEAERARWLEEDSLRNAFMQQYSETITEVYDNLERIRKREGFLIKASKDVEEQNKTPLKEKMLANIESIDTYLKSSKQKLATLRKKLQSSEGRITALNDLVENLSKTVEEKEKHIMELKDQIEQMTVKVTEAEWQLQEKEEIIEQQTRQLYTVYYIIGTEDELKEKGIIEEKGGLLGLRKTKRLAAGFDEDDFISADMSEINTIAINANARKVKVISPHDPNSYHLVKAENNDTVLEIIDPQKFWKIKYLVIIADS